MRLLILSLLFPTVLLAQPTAFYLGDGLENFDDQQLKSSSPVYLNYVTPDSLVIMPELGDVKHSATYKRNSNESFFRRKTSWSSVITNYAFTDQNAICLVQENGSYILFLRDPQAAKQVLSETDKTPVLHVKDSLLRVVARVNSVINTADKKVNDEAARKETARAKIVLSAYLNNFRTRRSDPELERQIIKWSNNNTTKVFITAENYNLVKNGFGLAVRKTIVALIKFHTNGKCYVQWRTFGYEFEGDHFSKDLSVYNTPDYTYKATGANDVKVMEQAVNYEVDCN
jgi:hypothetical protein